MQAFVTICQPVIIFQALLSRICTAAHGVSADSEATASRIGTAVVEKDETPQDSTKHTNNMFVAKTHYPNNGEAVRKVTGAAGSLLERRRREDFSPPIL